MSLWHVAKTSHTWGLTCKLPESNADTVRNFILWASFIWSLRTCHKLTMQRKRTTLLGCDSIDVAFSCLLPLGTVPLHHDRLECVPLLGNNDSRYFKMIAEEESHRFQNFHRLAKFEGFLHLHVNEVHLLQKRWSDQLQSFHFVATKTSDPSLGSKLSNQRFQVISMVSHEKKVDLIFPMAWTPTKTSLGMASMLSSPVARRSCDKQVLSSSWPPASRWLKRLAVVNNMHLSKIASNLSPFDVNPWFWGILIWRNNNGALLIYGSKSLQEMASPLRRDTCQKNSAINTKHVCVFIQWVHVVACAH